MGIDDAAAELVGRAGSVGPVLFQCPADRPRNLAVSWCAAESAAENGEFGSHGSAFVVAHGAAGNQRRAKTTMAKRNR